MLTDIFLDFMRGLILFNFCPKNLWKYFFVNISGLYSFLPNNHVCMIIRFGTLHIKNENL